MRILCISNFYPPYFIGGYELGCQDIANGLKERGHEVKVLTSTYGVGGPCCDGEIYRWLQADFGWDTSSYHRFASFFRKEITNQIAFRRLYTTFAPDIVYFWNLTHVSVSLAFTAQRMSPSVCYYVFDNWLSHWERDIWFSLWNGSSRSSIRGRGKTILSAIWRAIGLLPSLKSLDLSNVLFASQYLKNVALQAGKHVEDAKILYWGIDAQRYSFKKKSPHRKRLLFVGQIVPHKGMHTAIEALNRIVKQHGCGSASLTIVGGSIVPDYEAQVRRLVVSLGLEDCIKFMGCLSRDHLPHLYQEHDILIFPSVWDEPFGITLLEAMSSGLAVVCTATGGSAEICKDGFNAMVFPKQDAQACADQIMRLIRNPELFERIRRNGRHTVEEKFIFKNTMDSVENSLLTILKGSLNGTCG